MLHPNCEPFTPDWCSPPGDTILDLLEERGLDQAGRAYTGSICPARGLKSNAPFVLSCGILKVRNQRRLK
jgi:hypothetical protein